MLKMKKLASALTVLGLAIGTAPAGAFWDLVGGGIGGTTMWSPFDGRFRLKEGGDSTMEYITTVDGDELLLQMELEGFVFNDANTVDPVADDTPIGDFAFSIRYFGAQRTVLNDGQTQVTVPNTGFGVGELIYTLDTRQGTVDGEEQGDVIVFATPVNCTDLVGGNVECADNFFEWTGVTDGTIFPAFTDEDFDPGTGTQIPSNLVALLTGGIPSTCTSINDSTRNGYNPEFNEFECNPIQGSRSLDEYRSLLERFPAAINVDAAFVPAPGIVVLLGIGLAGMGAARRRVKAPDVT
jgi:hypothetical protein